MSVLSEVKICLVNLLTVGGWISIVGCIWKPCVESLLERCSQVTCDWISGQYRLQWPRASIPEYWISFLASLVMHLAGLLQCHYCCATMSAAASFLLMTNALYGPFPVVGFGMAVVAHDSPRPATFRHRLERRFGVWALFGLTFERRRSKRETLSQENAVRHNLRFLHSNAV